MRGVWVIDGLAQDHFFREHITAGAVHTRGNGRPFRRGLGAYVAHGQTPLGSGEAYEQDEEDYEIKQFHYLMTTQNLHRSMHSSLKVRPMLPGISPLRVRSRVLAAGKPTEFGPYR